MASVAQKQDKPRPHACTTCLRAFARLEHLKRHERSHTKEKPFECPVCERKFARRDLLLRHQQKLHAGLATTRQRQPRKNSITVATLSRPQKPVQRPRANTFSATGTPADAVHDAAASTNSWLESTFGKLGKADDPSARYYSAASATASASKPQQQNLFGSLYINPDLLPFTLPDNKSMGLFDEDAVEFDEEFWLGDAASARSPSKTDDCGSPASYGTPNSVSSVATASSSDDRGGIDTLFSFPPKASKHEPMSRSLMQTQVEHARLAQFDASTITPSLLLDHIYSDLSVDPLAAFDAQSPSPSVASTTSWSSNASSLNTSVTASSPPPLTPATLQLRAGSLPSGPSLVSTLSARSALPPKQARRCSESTRSFSADLLAEVADDATSAIPFFTTMAQLQLDSVSQLHR